MVAVTQLVIDGERLFTDKNIVGKSHFDTNLHWFTFYYVLALID